MASLNRAALARLRSVLQSHIDNQRIPGAIAVVALGDHVEMLEALGRLDPAAGTPMKDDAIFRVYSMTKPLVSLAALMLAEEGRLQMGDAVSKYLPEFANQKVAVEEGGAVRLLAGLLHSQVSLSREARRRAVRSKRCWRIATATSGSRPMARCCDCATGVA